MDNVSVLKDWCPGELLESRKSDLMKGEHGKDFRRHPGPIRILFKNKVELPDQSCVETELRPFFRGGLSVQVLKLCGSARYLKYSDLAALTMSRGSGIIASSKMRINASNVTVYQRADKAGLENILQVTARWARVSACSELSN